MWADGSCYMGSWVDGTPDGPGIYSWASGAFYEGTWKQGCMEGEGTYSDGYIGTFTGFWHDHKMHGCAFLPTTHSSPLEKKMAFFSFTCASSSHTHTRLMSATRQRSVQALAQFPNSLLIPQPASEVDGGGGDDGTGAHAVSEASSTLPATDTRGCWWMGS